MSKRTRYAKASFTRESVELITSLQFTRPRLEASSPRSGLRLARRRRTPALPLAAPPNLSTASVRGDSARLGPAMVTGQGCQPLSLCQFQLWTRRQAATAVKFVTTAPRPEVAEFTTPWPCAFYRDSEHEGPV